jgi:cytidyltransferase-like protein
MVVVYTDMNGISFHDGHASFLQACKQLGDVLLVGVCSEAICGGPHQPPLHPHARMQHRARVIEACRFVDQVIEDCPCPIHRDFIVRHGIDVVVRGFDTDRCSPRTFDAATWYDVPDEMGILRTVSVSCDAEWAGAHANSPTSSVSSHVDWSHSSVIQMRIEQMLLRLERATRGG